VVEFETDTGEIWVANFQSGRNGIDDVRRHPNGHDVLVISAGSAWQVNPNRREATEVGDAIDGTWSVSDPEGLVMSWQGLGFLRVGPEGRIWHTRRISWDGFKQVQLSPTEIRGFAWAPWAPEWVPFTVDLQTGRVDGGSYNGPDAAKWETLAGERSA
jgi:hypothetical protein